MKLDYKFIVTHEKPPKVNIQGHMTSTVNQNPPTTTTFNTNAPQLKLRPDDYSALGLEHAVQKPSKSTVENPENKENVFPKTSHTKQMQAKQNPFSINLEPPSKKKNRTRSKHGKFKTTSTGNTAEIPTSPSSKPPKKRARGGNRPQDSLNTLSNVAKPPLHPKRTSNPE